MQPQSNTPIEIPLTQGKVALIDAADFGRVNQHKWFAMRAQGGKYIYAGNKYLPAMHRFILNAPKGVVVDHINHNGLDNTRANLRLCTYAQNGQNRLTSMNNKVGLKGVSWHTLSKQWRAKTKFQNKYILIGYFDTAEAAARAYDTKARELFGEFARLNFPGE